MRVAGMVQDSIVDGPGLRFAVFTQGCEMRCAGCHNPGTWDKNGGTEIPIGDIIAKMLGNPLTDGLTLTGGEPFLQADQCVTLASAAREVGLNIWIYTGYDFEVLFARAQSEQSIKELMGLADVMIDRPFVLSERTLSLKWRGSTNQRILDMQKSIADGKPIEYVI